MATPQEREDAALTKLESGVNTIFHFANGPATDLVPTESGNIPTLAGVVAKIEDDHESFAQLVTDTTETLNTLPVDENTLPV